MAADGLNDANTRRMIVKDTAKYILGHSQDEISRLMRQASMVHPITERLLRQAGVQPGMRVLDLGCGAGDVSMLAAEFVGPRDRCSALTPTHKQLRWQSAAAGLPQITFKDVTLERISCCDLFDCVLCRFVLIHQTDPVDFLRRAARLVRAGGMIALHEVDLTEEFHSYPRVLRSNAPGNLILSAFQEALPHYDAANRLVEHFPLLGYQSLISSAKFRSAVARTHRSTNGLQTQCAAFGPNLSRWV
jgi:ubiquinone/menaquinone biosynthesis C-methylase UbiE